MMQGSSVVVVMVSGACAVAIAAMKQMTAMTHQFFIG